MEESVKEKSRTGLVVGLIMVVLLAMLAFGYMVGKNYYSERFPRNTTLNGMDISGKTAANVKQMMARQTRSFVLSIKERDGVTETLTAEDVGMEYADTGEVDGLLEGFNKWLWPIDYFRSTELEADGSSVTVDAQKAETAIDKLTCLSPMNSVAPVDARLECVDGQAVIVPEELGTQLKRQDTIQYIMDALLGYRAEADLDEGGCYVAPKVVAADAELKADQERANKLMKARITFDFEDDRVMTADGELIFTWLKKDDAGVLQLDYDSVFDWVKMKLARPTDTFGLTHEFKTSNGRTVTLKGGDYGWCVHREKTTEKLIAAIEAGEQTEMVPDYKFKGMFRGVNDIGDTYVEISIQEQRVWCYKDGKLIVDTPCVTGNPNKGNETPAGGVWALDAKKSPAVLGTIETMGYSSPVTYWMPFNKNVGLHDADGWRSSYGGQIYLTNGSHGCINLPKAAAKKIYEATTIGQAIIVY